MRKTGKYNSLIVAGEKGAAFIPFSLPPKNPSLQIGDVSLGHLQKAEQGLLQTGILQETTGKKRDRAYGYTEYLDLLKVGTEL